MHVGKNPPILQSIEIHKLYRLCENKKLRFKISSGFFLLFVSLAVVGKRETLLRPIRSGGYCMCYMYTYYLICLLLKFATFRRLLCIENTVFYHLYYHSYCIQFSLQF